MKFFSIASLASLIVSFCFLATIDVNNALASSGDDSTDRAIVEPAIGETVQGERVDPATYGPGIVESMDAVLQREKQRPQGEMVSPKTRNGRHGEWLVPQRRATYHPHSGIHNVVNRWGDTLMGIGFGQSVDVSGAWFAGQASQGAWTRGVRVFGYLNGQQVGATDWFNDIGAEPKFFAFNLSNVDRIVIEASAAIDGAGWYGMDDLTFTPLPAPGAAQPQQTVIDFEDCRFDQSLTGTNYKGLTWESGKGEFKADKDQAIPGPVRRADREGQPPPPPPVEEGGIAGGAGTTPNLTFNFQGVIRGDAGQGSFPPDTCGAIGPNHYLEVVNSNYSVYNKTTGVRIVNLSMGSFMPGGSGDNRVLFDQYSNRWIVINSDFNTRIYLAVSTTNDPTGSYFKTSFVASQGVDAGFLPDYPTLGVDANGIYIAAAFNSMSIFAIDKAPLIAASPSLGTVTAFRSLSFDGALQPVHTYSTPSPVGEMFISALFQNGSGSGTQLRLRRVNPPLTAPTLTSVANLGVTGFTAPPDAPAMGSIALDTIDTRLINAVYRGGFIWAAHTLNVSGRAACRWYKVNVASLSVADSGTIADPVRYYFFPSLSVNQLGDMAIGFAGSSSTQFAGSYYTGRAFNDPAGQTGVPALLKAGVSAYQLVDNVGRNRWGDYSLTNVDPSDDVTFWTVQEYAHSSVIWGTWIGKLVVTPQPFNNNCSNSIVVSPGPHAFTTVGATTDGPDEPSMCNSFGNTNILNDVWYLFGAQCTGAATFSLCGASFDAKMAVYTGACPTVPNTAIACNDNFCGSSPQVIIPVSAGMAYRIRIGGQGNVSGTGTLVVTCTPVQSPCPGDCAQPPNGFVNVDDLLAVINSWGPCPAPPASCPTDIAPSGGNGFVNVDDLLVVINSWGPCP